MFLPYNKDKTLKLYSAFVVLEAGHRGRTLCKLCLALARRAKPSGRGKPPRCFALITLPGLKPGPRRFRYLQVVEFSKS